MVLSIYLEVLLERGPHQPYFVAKKMDEKLVAPIVVYVGVCNIRAEVRGT